MLQDLFQWKVMLKCTGSRVWETRVGVLALPFTSCVTLEKLFTTELSLIFKMGLMDYFMYIRVNKVLNILPSGWQILLVMLVGMVTNHTIFFKWSQNYFELCYCIKTLSALSLEFSLFIWLLDFGIFNFCLIKCMPLWQRLDLEFALLSSVIA